MDFYCQIDPLLAKIASQTKIKGVKMIHIFCEYHSTKLQLNYHDSDSASNSASNEW